jgi:hypothetical protein
MAKSNQQAKLRDLGLPIGPVQSTCQEPTRPGFVWVDREAVRFEGFKTVKYTAHSDHPAGTLLSTSYKAEDNVWHLVTPAGKVWVEESLSERIATRSDRPNYGDTLQIHSATYRDADGDKAATHTIDGRWEFFGIYKSKFAAAPACKAPEPAPAG